MSVKRSGRQEGKQSQDGKAKEREEKKEKRRPAIEEVKMIERIMEEKRMKRKT